VFFFFFFFLCFFFFVCFWGGGGGGPAELCSFVCTCTCIMCLEEDVGCR